MEILITFKEIPKKNRSCSYSCIRLKDLKLIRKGRCHYESQCVAITSNLENINREPITKWDLQTRFWSGRYRLFVARRLLAVIRTFSMVADRQLSCRPICAIWAPNPKNCCSMNTLTPACRLNCSDASESVISIVSAI